MVCFEGPEGEATFGIPLHKVYAEFVSPFHLFCSYYMSVSEGGEG